MEYKAGNHPSPTVVSIQDSDRQVLGRSGRKKKRVREKETREGRGGERPVNFDCIYHLVVPAASSVISRVSQKFVPLISCTITFDQNYIFT